MILWLKAFHILFVMAWMAGVFYLPRILVHYTEGRSAGEDTRRLVIMADKLFRFSTLMALPAMASGAILWLYYGITGAWLHAKLALVALLVGYQYQTLRYLTMMRRDELIRSSLFFRLYNEAALLLAAPILIFVVVKPFA